MQQPKNVWLVTGAGLLAVCLGVVLVAQALLDYDHPIWKVITGLALFLTVYAVRELIRQSRKKKHSQGLTGGS